MPGTGAELDIELPVQELYAYPDASTADDEDVQRLDEDLLDLTVVLRDAVVLALPLQPVCRDDCPGLCPECGARLARRPDARARDGRPTVGGLAGPDRFRPGDLTSTRPDLGPGLREEELAVAVPKRKTSRTNTRHRRSQWKAAAPHADDV